MRTLSDDFWDYFDAHHGAFAILFNFLIALCAVGIHAFIPNFGLVGLAAVSLLAIIALDYYLKDKREHRRSLRQHSNLLTRLLDAASASVLQIANPPVRHIRACLMMPDANDKLTIRYAFGFGRLDKDLGVEIPIGTGCCGQAWLQGDTMLADLRQVNGMPDHWGLPREEIAKIRPSLRTILSVPVRAGEGYKVVAILNIDTDNETPTSGFEREAIQDIAYCFATVIGSVVEDSYVR